jgi:hypothetical protein
MNTKRLLLIALVLIVVLAGCMSTPTSAPTLAPTSTLPTPNPAEVATEVPIALTPELTATAEIVTPENLVKVEFKSENLEENITAWQEGRMDYQLMEVTEAGWGSGLGLVVDEKETGIKLSKEFNPYYFQGVYLGRETIKLKISEKMANPENISLPIEYKNYYRMEEDVSITFNRLANSVIGGFPDGVDNTVVFVGMENGVIIPLSMGYEVEGKDIMKEGLATNKCPDITNGKFPSRDEVFYLEKTPVNASVSLVDVKAGQTIAFEIKVVTKYEVAYLLNTMDSRPKDLVVHLNVLSLVSGRNSNNQEMANGNFELLNVKSGEDITWLQLFTMPYVTEYFVSRK